MITFENNNEPKHLQPCMFKCNDFTTEIIGRYDNVEKAFFVERGDGNKYWYRFGVAWYKELEIKQ